LEAGRRADDPVEQVHLQRPEAFERLRETELEHSLAAVLIGKVAACTGSPKFVDSR
jgi:hypothetical protein